MNHPLPKRKPNRLKDYDYSSNGVYFVTICTKDRKMVFGSVGAINDRPPMMILSRYGKMAEKAILNIHQHYPAVMVDHYVVMPNHIHMLLRIDRENGRSMIAPIIFTVIRHLKGYISREIGQPIWQKSFHDHIVRDERSYRELWNYIDINPMKWEDDCFYSQI